MTGSSGYKFAILTKIVKHLKMLHQNGNHEPLTLEQILDETNQLDVSAKIPGVSFHSHQQPYNVH